MARDLSRREAGEEHQAAVQGISSLLPGWKRREGMAAVLLKIVNLEPRPRRAGVFPFHRLYTIQKAFAGEAVVLTGAQKKPLATKLADPPRNLRALQLRVKKFWTTGDGTTRRRAYDPDDPLSIGRKPKLSRPFSALLIEEKPVEAELLLKPKPRKDPLPHLSLQELKRYEGPFEDGLLDLNRGRRWDPIPPLELELRAPAGGLVTPPAVLELAGEVRAASPAAATAPRHPES